MSMVPRDLGERSGPADGEMDFDEHLPLIGRAPAMRKIYRTLARLMVTDLTVMIVGEFGTGKELIARTLHEYGKRRGAAFIPVNMTAIPPELVESELFGDDKGAFTGEVARKKSRFEQADGGTLFLDEVSDMPTEAQIRLLRVLQEGEFNPVGGDHPQNANVRIIAATRRNLRHLVAQGLFREDLFSQLNDVSIHVPPLRERKEDIPLLMRHFLVCAINEGMPAKNISVAAMRHLKMHDWPGNVGELENIARRLALLQSDEIIEPATVDNELVGGMPLRVGADGDAKPHTEILPSGDNLGLAVERHLGEYFAAHLDGLPPNGLYGRILREVERPLLIVSLRATGGNQLKTAKMLGLNRNTLRKKIRDLNIRVIRGVKPGSSNYD